MYLDQKVTIWQRVHFNNEQDMQKAIEQREINWQEEIGYKDKEIFEAFIALPTPQKKIVREVIVAFAKAYINTE